MKGCRALTDEEIDQLKKYFDERLNNPSDSVALRDKTLIFLSMYIGTRISETLSIKIGDVWRFGKVTDEVYIKREQMKGRREGRRCPLNSGARELLHHYLTHYKLDRLEELQVRNYPLFTGRGREDALGVRQATRIFQLAFMGCEFTGKLATHTSRKVFARKVYEAVDKNIVDLQQAMGHKEISSTVHYISSDNKAVGTAIDNLKL